MRRLSLTIYLMLAFAVEAACPAWAIYGIDDKYDVKESPKISMDFKDADLADVLKVLSQQSGMNFVASSALAGKTINLYLDNVPVDQALERILSANGLTYEMEADSNILLVKPLVQDAKELMTRVYYLKYATVSASKLNKVLDFSSSSNDLTSSSSNSAGQGDSQKSGIMGAVQAVLSPDGNLIEDQRTNSLVITDIPSRFPVIEQTIAKLDVRVPQVVIELEMLDVSKNSADKLGVKFGETPFELSGASRETQFPFREADGAFNYTAGTLSYTGLQMTLQFLKTQTDTKSLARPRIMTLNNEMAEIRISTDEAISLTQSQSSAEGQATTSLEAERVETGVFLRVTPQINVQTHEITMAIEPKVVQAKDGSTFDGQTVKDPETRGTKSILRVKDGDTVVIGGLLRNENSQTKTKVPGLSSVPILGAAFRHKSKSEQQRELIVFITPHVVSDNPQESSISTSLSSIASQQPKVSEDRLNAINKEMMLYEKRGSNP